MTQNPLTGILAALNTWTGRLGALVMILAGFHGWLADHQLPTLVTVAPDMSKSGIYPLTAYGMPTMLCWFLFGAIVVSLAKKK